jgi:eukaryotic-like serine/threonine-protein kinase
MKPRPDDIDPALPDVFAQAARPAPLEPALPSDAFLPARMAEPSTALGPPARTRARQAPRTQLRPGAIVDKYRVEELLGVGGFAVVYRATHMLLRVPVALKLLRADVVARRPSLAAQLLQEARFAARIDHPNVVRVFDVTHTEHITYIVMEFIRGTSVARLIDEAGRLPPSAVVRIGIDVAAGLAAGLEQGLIHRDIKPANILLTAARSARIVDLGLANPITPGADDDGPLSHAALVGTRGYMSPEQIRDPRAVDFRCDIYSLGVTLREAATGVSPSSRSRSALAARTTTPELDRLLAWMTSPEPADRPASYAELDEALRTIRLADEPVRHS